jgi:hypothetical protein
MITIAAKVLSWVLIPIFLTAVILGTILTSNSPYYSEGLGDRVLLIGFAAIVVIAVLMLARRPDHPLTWVLAFVAVTTSLGPALETYAEARLRTHGSADPLAFLGLWLNSWYWLPMLVAVLVFIPLLFPDGHWPSPRWRWIGRLLVALAAAVTLAGMLAGRLEGQGRVYADRDVLPTAFVCAPDDEDPTRVLCAPTVANIVGIPGFEGAESSFVWAFLLPPLFLGGLATAAVAVVVRFRRSRGLERQQHKWLLFAATLLPLPILLESVPVVGPLTLPIALAAVPAAIAVAILRYRLYDIDRIVSRTVTYALLTAVLAGIYAGLVLGIQRLVGPDDAPDLVVAGATLVVAGLFRPVRSRIQALVDRRFNRRHRRAEAHDPMPRRLLPVRRPASRSTSTHDCKLDFQSPGPVDLDTLKLGAARCAGVKLVVPLVTQGELIGLLNLGPRLSEQEYSADDRKLLENLAAQAAPALRVAQLVRSRRSRSDARALRAGARVAQLIQQNFLPQELPQHAGWQLDAFYRPAREVGGDFYDFIDLPDGRLGIVVGDVTDKGVPAALVMASTRSVLRASAQRLVEPGGSVLERSTTRSTRTCRRMFVTCLYGVLDPATGDLRFANAGHNLPCVQTADGASSRGRPACRSGSCPG